MSAIKENLEKIRERIKNAALRAGRDPQSVSLVAVSKKIDSMLIEEAIACGQTLFGENYMQEAKEKISFLQAAAQWHFIGHIQSKKAKDAATLFDLVHTVDRLKLAQALDKHAGLAGRILSVLVQINVSGEAQKEGVAPENAEELLAVMGELPNLKIRGLMTMPPFMDNPEDVRPFFRTLRQLAEHFAAKGYFDRRDGFELSMGMSGDFEVAIEEGATLVRVGTAIFGSRL
ncbi:MAG: YggS family pyridoxal phosphate-dependent enzyme [Proteobacteria bacterium]|nr:YggS family pyridoxal phosphate-dependent enzyme [Pseudomonadota bacterium]MBU4295622.1 YggS family pyridoxal phosphate-dependent enzyme [Pseudomonadota bacterium]MCG2746813.1 YggS family pyridoxal phosphate-dependent enzyme [Desulfobulbaceae bacterium]